MKLPLKSQRLEESNSRCPWVSLPLAFIRWIPDWSAALGERLTFAFASHLESAWSLSWLESCHFYATASWGTHAVPGRTHHLCLHFAVGTWLSSEQSAPPFLASGWDQWALHGMDSLLCNTPTHSWLVLCPDQHFCRSPVTFTWLKKCLGLHQMTRLWNWEKREVYQLEKGRECSGNLILWSATNNLTKRCSSCIVSSWWKYVKDLVPIWTDIKRWVFILTRHGCRGER